MRITAIHDIVAPISSAIANAYIDFSRMTASVVAIHTDRMRDGKPLVGFGFNSNGRYAVQGLLRERFINNFKVIEDSKQGVLRIYLKYASDEVSVITGIKRVSTPGRRLYVAKDQIPRVMGGMGTSILSTSRGLMTDREARDAGLGGEIMCQIW